MGSATSIIKLSLESNQYEQGLRGAKRQFEDFTASIGINMKKMTAYGLAAGAAASAINSLVSTISTAITEGSRMAKEMEGVRAAFKRLDQPGLLDNLREATHGTVNDLELMKQAVKFDNFNLSLKEMGTMLAFAQQQAKDTGQEVGYLVDSIVTGLGRKSLPILDNLGLSATEIKDRMKETGDMTKAVAQIIEERMNAAGGYVETAADRAAKANADLENAMTRLGETFQPLSDAGTSLWNDLKLGAIDLLNNAVRPLIDALTEAGRIRSQYASQGGDKRVNRQLDRLKGISTKEYRQGTYKAQLGNYDTKISSYEQYLKDYKKWQSDKTSVGAYDRMQAFQKQTGMSGYADVKEQLGVFKKMRAEYVMGANNIINENPAPSPTDNTPKNKGGRRSKKEFNVSAIEFNPQKAALAAVKGEDKMPSAFEMLKPEDMLGSADEWEAYKDSITDSVGSISEAFTNLTNWSENFDPLEEYIKRDNKELRKMVQSTGLAAEAIGSIGSAFSQIEDPAAKVMGTVMQSIASIALGYAQATVAAAQTGNPWVWAAFAAAGLAQMIAMITTIHSQTGYADGGMVIGNSYSGDNIGGVVDGSKFVGLNAGEVVLNAAQQSSLAQQLEGGGMQNLRLDGVISGENIHIVHNRYLKRSGQGEIVTW